MIARLVRAVRGGGAPTQSQSAAGSPAAIGQTPGSGRPSACREVWSGNLDGSLDAYLVDVEGRSFEHLFSFTGGIPFSTDDLADGAYLATQDVPQLVRIARLLKARVDELEGRAA